MALGLADDLVNDGYVQEDIPMEDFLYLRVHKNALENEHPANIAFHSKTGDLSTNWDRYSTPHKTRAEAKTTKGRPIDLYAIIKIPVKLVRSFAELGVFHTPIKDEIDDNQAHSDIRGLNIKDRIRKIVVRDLLWEGSPIVLQLGQE